MATTSISGWAGAGDRTMYLTVTSSAVSDEIASIKTEVYIGGGGSTYYNSHIKLVAEDLGSGAQYLIYEDSGTWDSGKWFVANGGYQAFTDTWSRFSYVRTVRVHIYGYAYTYSDKHSYVDVTIPTLPTYTITYKANGGSSTPTSQTKYYNSSIYLAGAISRTSVNTNGYVVSFNTDGIGTTPSKLTQVVTTSYTFKNWYGSNGAYYNAGAYYSTNASLTLTAQWNSTTVRKPITLPAIPSRTGYTVDGWYTVNGLKIGNAGDSWVPTSTITLYAKWTARTFTISLNNNGAVTTTNVQYDSTYNLPTPTRAGYKFLGWYTAAEGGTKIQNGTTIQILTNVTYYAHWEAMGATYVYSNGSFKQGLCYVYTSSGWKHALPYVYTNGTWKLTTF